MSSGTNIRDSWMDGWWWLSPLPRSEGVAGQSRDGLALFLRQKLGRDDVLLSGCQHYLFLASQLQLLLILPIASVAARDSEFIFD